MAVHFSAPRDGWRRRGGKIDQGFRPESRAPAGTTSAGGQTSHDIGPAWLPYNSIPGTGTGSPATDKSGGFFWRLFGYMPETDENSGVPGLEPGAQRIQRTNTQMSQIGHKELWRDAI